MTDEEFHDAEIAPGLLRLGGLCQERGLSFVSAVQYAPDGVSQTTTLTADAGFAIRLVDLAVRAKGNADTLILAIMRHAAEHGHSSLCLARLGVPATPSGQGAGAADAASGSPTS